MIIEILKKLKKLLLFFSYKIKYFFLVSKDLKNKYSDDFLKITIKLDKNENFAFTRFSDGEIFILQNKKLEISSNTSKLDNKIISKTNYTKEERKLFDPEIHQFYREKLIQSLKFKKKNYFRGMPCLCCNGDIMKNYLDQISYISEYDTYSNLLINGNYNNFLNLMTNVLRKKKVIIICNKYASIEKLPFKVLKKFEVGYNCFINDYSLISIIDEYIINNSIKDYIFLFSASSLSNLAIHQLFNKHDYNTYIDIGSALNPYMDMPGWRNTRGYLQEYWLEKKPYIFLNRKCY